MILLNNGQKLNKRWRNTLCTLSVILLMIIIEWTMYPGWMLLSQYGATTNIRVEDNNRKSNKSSSSSISQLDNPNVVSSLNPKPSTTSSSSYLTTKQQMFHNHNISHDGNKNNRNRSDLIDSPIIEQNRSNNNEKNHSNNNHNITYSSAVHDSSRPFANNTNKYPLDGMHENSNINISAATIAASKEAFQKGFLQAMRPIAADRWEAVSNVTCINNDSNNNESSLEEWNLRAPYVIMIGAQKGGTTALADYLYNHPKIVRSHVKEFHYFSETMDENENIIKSYKKKKKESSHNDDKRESSEETVEEGGIPALLALRHYQDSVIGRVIPMQKFRLEEEVRYIMDATPNYLLLSDRVPQRICCVTPWVKLLGVLRNPVDRAFSQYHMQISQNLKNPNAKSRQFPTFEEYVHMDIKVLKETGVIQDWSIADFETFSGSEQEFQAWQTYTKLGLNAPVGRGLYSLQLLHWMKALEAFCGENKSRDDLLIVKSEDMKVDADGIYNDVLEFLKLPPHHLNSYEAIHKTAYRGAAARMAPETRQLLENVYYPYNLQLEKLFGINWTLS